MLFQIQKIVSKNFQNLVQISFKSYLKKIEKFSQKIWVKFQNTPLPSHLQIRKSVKIFSQNPVQILFKFPLKNRWETLEL
nr:MAG TPA: hypothetical protein [Bacteriophage sp.]DAW77675.1 MAG TPA: hypothetical protein [Bacteriophage sp.]